MGKNKQLKTSLLTTYLLIDLASTGLGIFYFLRVQWRGETIVEGKSGFHSEGMLVVVVWNNQT